MIGLRASRILAFIAVAIAGFLLASCGGSAHRDGDASVQAPHIRDLGPALPPITTVTHDSGRPLQVVATTSIIGDIVGVVGAEEIDLSILMPRGQNPHSYDPPPSAFRTLERADLVFINGFDLEAGMLDTIEAVATGQVIPISAGVAIQEDDDESHAHGDANPHVWMDPNNVVIWVNNTVTVLSAADPGNAETYEANGSAYVAGLRDLDTQIRDGVAGISEARRRVVVDHESFAYFAREYGFRILGAMVPGTTDSAEPSPGEIAGLVDLMRREDVRTILVGATTSQGLQRLSSAIAGEAGGEAQIITILTGSLAPSGQTGDTYLGFMKYNLAQILSGLEE